MKLEPTLSKNDMAVAGEGVLVLLEDRSPVLSLRESTLSLVTMVTLIPEEGLVPEEGIEGVIVAARKK